MKYRLSQCKYCGNERHSLSAVRCTECASPLVNRCTDPKCNHLNHTEAAFCEECGYPTDFYEGGLLFRDNELD